MYEQEYGRSPAWVLVILFIIGVLCFTAAYGADLFPNLTDNQAPQSAEPRSMPTPTPEVQPTQVPAEPTVPLAREVALTETAAAQAEKELQQSFATQTALAYQQEQATQQAARQALEAQMAQVAVRQTSVAVAEKEAALQSQVADANARRVREQQVWQAVTALSLAAAVALVIMAGGLALLRNFQARREADEATAARLAEEQKVLAMRYQVNKIHQAERIVRLDQKVEKIVSLNGSGNGRAHPGREPEKGITKLPA